MDISEVRTCDSDSDRMKHEVQLRLCSNISACVKLGQLNKVVQQS